MELKTAARRNEGADCSTIDAGSNHTLSGQVVQSATQAAVTLQGTSGGAVVDTATFRLTGSLGHSDISIQQGESLSAVAKAVGLRLTVEPV